MSKRKIIGTEIIALEVYFSALISVVVIRALLIRLFSNAY